MSSWPQVAKSVDDEDRRMGACPCGGRWRVARETLVPTRGRWVDDLVVRCDSCMTPNGFLFDVTEFFEPRPGVWTTAQDRE